MINKLQQDCDVMLALNPIYGEERVTRMVQLAFTQGRSVMDVALATTDMSKSDILALIANR
ncbi:MAG: hypothetical protein ACPGPF_04230 [Pontibacterium sp.]